MNLVAIKNIKRSITLLRNGKIRKEIWQAETSDGKYLLCRLEEDGTPWAAIRVADKVQSCWFGSLKRLRAALASDLVDKCFLDSQARTP